MKTTAFLLLSAFLCRAALADLVVVEQMESPMQSGTMTIQIKDSKARIDMPTVSVITDSTSGDSVTLMHQQKNYMKISGTAMKAMQENMMKMNPAAANAAPPQLTPTGRSEKISGYATDEYTTSVGNMKTAYWIAKDFPQFKQLLTQMLKMQQSGPAQAMRNMMPRPEDFPGMPIRTVVDLGGQTMKTTVIEVKDQKVAPSAFELPADYKEMVMPAFGNPPAAK
jgi:hypothetical protein